MEAGAELRRCAEEQKQKVTVILSLACVTGNLAALLDAVQGMVSQMSGPNFRTGIMMVSIAQAAAGVAPAYDLDDLDDEWKALLNELEDRLYQVHSSAFPNHRADSLHEES